MPEILSKDNPRLKHARAAREGRVRDAIFIEGLRLSEEAAAHLAVSDFFFTTEFAENQRGAELLEKLADVNGAVVSAKLLESISDTKTPPGIIILAARPDTGQAILEKTLTIDAPPLIVILHELNNPVNVGAILRTAEAANAAGVILTEKCADVFAPKAIRAAMGSAFRLPLWTNAEFAAALDLCRQHNLKTVCAAGSAAQTHLEIDWRTPAALIIGSEAHGLAADEIAACDESLRIPMQQPVESLNAAVACGVVLYEAMRQRTGSAGCQPASSAAARDNSH